MGHHLRVCSPPVPCSLYRLLHISDSPLFHLEPRRRYGEVRRTKCRKFDPSLQRGWKWSWWPKMPMKHATLTPSCRKATVRQLQHKIKYLRLFTLSDHKQHTCPAPYYTALGKTYRLRSEIMKSCEYLKFVRSSARILLSPRNGRL